MAFPPGTTFYEAGSDNDRSPDSGYDFDQGSQYGSDSETARSPNSDYGSDYGSQAEEEDFEEQEEENEVSDSDYATPSPEPAVVLPWNMPAPEPVAPWQETSQGSLPEPVAPWPETLPEDQADFSTLDPEPDIEADPQPELTEADVLDLQQELLQEITQAAVVNPYWDQYKESAWAAPAAPKVAPIPETNTTAEPTQDQGETLYVFSFRLELFRLMRSMAEYRYRSNLDALCRAATNVICHRMGYSRALMEDLHPVLTRIGVKISPAS